MIYIGVDIGSTYTKYCVMNGQREIISLFSEKTPVRQGEYFHQKYRELMNQYPDAKIVSCGYGKKNIPAIRNVNELTALARGGDYICPNLDTILDIGGQDTKIICHESGKLKKFFINDKCAAGSGMFLANGLQLLGTEFTAIDLDKKEDSGIKLSTMCAVFAQSEIVQLLASNISENKILQAIILQILAQAKSLTAKVKESAILLSGGLTLIKGIENFATQVLGEKCFITKKGVYLSAIGCALISSKDCE